MVEGFYDGPTFAQLGLFLPLRNLEPVIVLFLFLFFLGGIFLLFGVLLGLQAVGFLVLGPGSPEGAQLLRLIDVGGLVVVVGIVEVGRVKIDCVDPVQEAFVLVFHHLSDVVFALGPVPVAASELGILVAADQVGKHCHEVEICQILCSQTLASVVVGLVESRGGGGEALVGMREMVSAARVQGIWSASSSESLAAGGVRTISGMAGMIDFSSDSVTLSGEVQAVSGVSGSDAVSEVWVLSVLTVCVVSLEKLDL